MPTNYRTLNQTREPETIVSSDTAWITTTPATSTQATTTWAGTPSVTTNSYATRVYIDASSAPSDGWIDWSRNLTTDFYRPRKENPRIEIPRELTDEELVKVLNS